MKLLLNPRMVWSGHWDGVDFPTPPTIMQVEPPEEPIGLQYHRGFWTDPRSKSLSLKALSFVFRSSIKKLVCCILSAGSAGECGSFQSGLTVPQGPSSELPWTPVGLYLRKRRLEIMLCVIILNIFWIYFLIYLMFIIIFRIFLIKCTSTLVIRSRCSFIWEY